MHVESKVGRGPSATANGLTGATVSIKIVDQWAVSEVLEVIHGKRDQFKVIKIQFRV